MTRFLALLLLLLSAPLAWAQAPGEEEAPPQQNNPIAETVLPDAWLNEVIWEFVHSEEEADTLRRAVFWSDRGTAVTLSGPGPLQVHLLAFYPEQVPTEAALRRSPPATECPTDAPPLMACRIIPTPNSD